MPDNGDKAHNDTAEKGVPANGQTQPAERKKLVGSLVLTMLVMLIVCQALFSALLMNA